MTKYLPFFVMLVLLSCNNTTSKEPAENETGKVKILIDTDANNELDDQHALAYAFLNNEVFDIVGITVNNTINGEGIQGHYDEAMRIIQLFNLQNKIPLKKGAVGLYNDIVPAIDESGFDGQEAVDFIISEAKKMKDEKLILLPIGKLTNIALALKKSPEIKNKIKVVWLGSNYPEPGEYNLVNDTTAVNPVIESGVEFEMVTVRYGQPSGTAAVTITPKEIKQHVAGKGPTASTPITGRHGGEFDNFGDYSVDLFEHIDLHGNPPSRALFDMAAVAVVKNPDWAKQKTISAPKLNGKSWVEQPNNNNKIVIWEDFNKDAIVNDFFTKLNQNK